MLKFDKLKIEEMDIAVEKKEIVKWLNSLDNPAVIEQIKQIKQKNTEPFDFEKEWENGITINEGRRKTANFVKSLPWEK